MDKIITYLDISITGAKYFEEPLNDVDWDKRTGVLLTVNEAEQVLEALKELTELKKLKDNESN